MNALDTIESEIKNLSINDLAKFRRWFNSFDADTWDIQIEKDAANGKLDALAHEALCEYKSGQLKEICNTTHQAR